MKRIIVCLLLLTVFVVSGHEFWIQPDKFIYKRGETINLKFLVGENFKGENWNGDKEKIANLSLYFDDVTDKNLTDDLGNGKGDSVQLSMLDEGTVTVTLNTKNSFIDLGAKEFNDYLSEEGLTDAIEYRKQNGDSLKKGAEYYQRSSKTIFQVGSKSTNAFKRKTDLPLDIVPEENPYTVDKDGNFKLQVFFAGDLLKNHKMKVWHKVNNKLSQIDYTTDGEGKMKIFLSPEGEWMVSCVKMVRVENDSKAEWQSYWGSLTWGYY